MSFPRSLLLRRQEVGMTGKSLEMNLREKIKLFFILVCNFDLLSLVFDVI